jgi:hypothetical protein
MAIQTLSDDVSPANPVRRLLGAPVPPAAISRVLASFERNQLAGFIAVAIDLLDLADDDPDAEDDERAGILMFAPGVDYDPAEDPPCVSDGLPGDSDDGENDDPGEDDDPTSGNVEDEGEAVNEDGTDAVFATLPYYRLDHRSGPINEREAHRAHTLAVLER